MNQKDHGSQQWLPLGWFPPRILSSLFSLGSTATVVPAIILAQIEPFYIMARGTFIREDSSKMYTGECHWSGYMIETSSSKVALWLLRPWSSANHRGVQFKSILTFLVLLPFCLRYCICSMSIREWNALQFGSLRRLLPFILLPYRIPIW